jgi:hypothetical protein
VLGDRDHDRRGYVWMAYPTFQALAQGDGVFIGKPRDPFG